METVVEFKAGLLVLTDGLLKPDTRKGLIRVAQDEAGLTHFCWHERDASGGAGDAETDLVIIPGECTFSKISRPGSRVFELKFPEEKHRNMFFWAQEPAADQDEDYVAAVNFALNQELAEEGSEGEEGGGPRAMDAEAPAAAAAAAAAAPTAAPTAAAPAGAGGGSGGGAIGAADLAAVLGNILAGGLQQGGAAAGLQQQLLQQRQAALDPGPSLSEVLKPELVGPLVAAPEMVQRLAPYLPEEHRSAAAIRQLVSTPQFRHQLELFSHALMTGQLDTRQFGLPPGGFGVLDFLKSIQQQADKEKQQQQQQQAGAGGGGGTAGQQQ